MIASLSAVPILTSDGMSFLIVTYTYIVICAVASKSMKALCNAVRVIFAGGSSLFANPASTLSTSFTSCLHFFSPMLRFFVQPFSSTWAELQQYQHSTPSPLKFSLPLVTFVSLFSAMSALLWLVSPSISIISVTEALVVYVRYHSII